MTNPTTPLPVQEPAGAVEAKAREAFEARGQNSKRLLWKRGGSVFAEDVPESDYVDAGTQHEWVLWLESWNAALASLPPVTQAKSEAVAEHLGILRRNVPLGLDWGCEFTPNFEAVKRLDCGVYLLYAAPQEAVERQPLTDDEMRKGHQYGCDWEAFVRGVRFAERHFGIGPATQETQHG